MKKDNRSVIQTLTLIFQFGISMLVPIFLCSILGVWLGNLTGINWLMIPFFFMGALAGFTNIYKTVRKLYRQEEKKENHEEKQKRSITGAGRLNFIIWGDGRTDRGMVCKGQDCIFHRGMVWHSGCRGDGNQSCNCDL